MLKQSTDTSINGNIVYIFQLPDVNGQLYTKCYFACSDVGIKSRQYGSWSCD